MIIVHQGIYFYQKIYSNIQTLIILSDCLHIIEISEK